MTSTAPASAVDVAPLRGIHHVKVAVTDLDRALRFYEQALQATKLPGADHRHADGSAYAYILEVPGLGSYLEVRLDPEQARGHRWFDAFTIAVDDRAALESWSTLLTHRHIPHSPILVALQAWLLVVEDPDQNRFRLYTLEQHGPELRPVQDDPWIRT